VHLMAAARGTDKLPNHKRAARELRSLIGFDADFMPAALAFSSLKICCLFREAKAARKGEGARAWLPRDVRVVP
jgi:hypothetical protein